MAQQKSLNIQDSLTVTLLTAIAVIFTAIRQPVASITASVSVPLYLTLIKKLSPKQETQTEPVTNTSSPPPENRGIVSMLVDGDNLFYEMQAHHWWLDYRTLLANVTAAGETVEAWYYTGIDPATRPQHQKFLTTLEDFGYQIATNPGKKTNRDLAIQLEILRSAHRKDVSRIILLSGDGDFCEAVEYAKQHGKYVEVMGFSTSSSFQLRRIAASHWIDITKLPICTKKIATITKPRRKAI